MLIKRHPATLQKKTVKNAAIDNTDTKSAKKVAKPALYQDTNIKQVHESHGKDMHFIPSHYQVDPSTIRDSILEEKHFHHGEEVAIHDENQKVKAAETSHSGRKRTSRNRGRV